MCSSEASGARVRKGATQLPLRSLHLTRSARRLFCILILTKERIHTSIFAALEYVLNDIIYT